MTNEITQARDSFIYRMTREYPGLTTTIPMDGSARTRWTPSPSRVIISHADYNVVQDIRNRHRGYSDSLGDGRVVIRF